MADDFELDAKWWLPGKPRRTVDGRLAYSKTSGITLFLRGTLPRLADSEGAVKSLFGMSQDGVRFTLFRPLRTATRNAIPGYEIQEYVSTLLIVGQHHRTQSTGKTREVEVEYSHIAEWVGHSPFTIHGNPPSQASYEPWQGFSLSIGDTGITIVAEQRQRHSHTFVRELTWIVTPVIKIQAPAPLDIEQVIEYAQTVRDLLTLLTGVRIGIRKIVARAAPIPLDEELLPGEMTRPSFQVLPTPHQTVDEELHPRDFFLDYDRLEGSLGAIFNEWFARRRKLETVTSLLMGTLQGDFIPIEFLFLSLMQALESFHRVTSTGRFETPSKYRRIRERLVAAIPADIQRDHRQALKNRIRFGNEYSLRRRLKELKRCLPSALAENLNTEHVDRLVQTRNHLAHGLTRKTRGVMSFKEIIEATEKLKALLYVLLLSEIGVDSGAIQALSSDNRRFRHLLSTSVV